MLLHNDMEYLGLAFPRKDRIIKDFATLTVLLLRRDLDLQFGRMDKEMEIKFELEDSDIVVDFIPDFRVSTNYTDQTKVSWRLSGRNVAVNVGILCPELPTESTIYSPVLSRSDV